MRPCPPTRRWSAGTRAFAVTLKTAGSRTVTATYVSGSPSLPRRHQRADHGRPGVATHFSVVAPASTTAGARINVTVTALDAYGNVDTGYAGTVHFTSTDAAATLPADATLVPGTGTRTFSATLADSRQPDHHGARTRSRAPSTARAAPSRSIPRPPPNISLVLTPEHRSSPTVRPRRPRARPSRMRPATASPARRSPSRPRVT